MPHMTQGYPFEWKVLEFAANYDPFDPLEYTWISWHKIERSTMERLIGKQFDEGDFTKHSGAALRAPELDPPNTFPVSWEVMF